MLLPILGVIAAIVVILAVVIAMQPTQFTVTRSAYMAVPPAAPFAEVNDFRKWEAWNPWGKIDPAMTHAYDGAPAGVGAKYAWAGNNEVGEGRMTITESLPNERIVIALEFIKPFAGKSTGTFTFVPENEGTRVTWRMDGTNNFIAKGMGLVMNMDKMIGDQFDKGLADIKALVENTPQT